MANVDANDAPQVEQNELAEHMNDEAQLGTFFLKVQSQTNVDDLSLDDIDQGGFSDRSEFDDSSDQDYTQSEESEDGESDQGSDIPSDLLVDDDYMFGEETSKDMGGTDNEHGGIGGWCDDVITDEDDVPIYDEHDEEGPRHPIFREGQDISNFKLVVGLRFKGAKQCRDVLTDVSIRDGFELTFIKNEKKRITAECKEKCGWRFHASVVMGGPTFQIKTLKGRHTCPRAHKNWRANYKYLAGKIERLIRENPCIKAYKISQYISRECGVDVSKWTVYRAKKTAIQKIRGVDSVQYALLRDYCETILKYNPGSKIIIRIQEGSDPPIFGKLYYSLFGLKMNFLSACRPIIGLDGCFLKTAFGGQLLAAVGTW